MENRVWTRRRNGTLPYVADPCNYIALPHGLNFCGREKSWVWLFGLCWITEFNIVAFSWCRKLSREVATFFSLLDSLIDPVYPKSNEMRNSSELRYSVRVCVIRFKKWIKISFVTFESVWVSRQVYELGDWEARKTMYSRRQWIYQFLRIRKWLIVVWDLYAFLKGIWGQVSNTYLSQVRLILAYAHAICVWSPFFRKKTHKLWNEKICLTPTDWKVLTFWNLTS